MTDHFGVPTGVFGSVPEDAYGALGRIVALGALVEMRFAQVVTDLERLNKTAAAGCQMGQLRKRFDRVSSRYSAIGSPIPDRLVALESHASRAMGNGTLSFTACGLSRPSTMPAVGVSVPSAGRQPTVHPWSGRTRASRI